jgi:DNA mismatch repair protein MutL
MYALVRAAVKQSLGKFNLTPTIDFDVHPSIDVLPPESNTEINPPSIKINPEYNPFESYKQSTNKELSEKKNLRNWATLFPESANGKFSSINNIDHLNQNNKTQQKNIFDNSEILDNFEEPEKLVYQLQPRYILTKVKSGLMIIDKQRAIERIMFEKYLDCLNNGEIASQSELFPRTMQLNPADSEIIDSLIDELKLLGFDISMLGPRTISINGIPAELEIDDIENWIESFIETFKNLEGEAIKNKNVKIAVSLAKSASAKMNRKLQKEEMLSIIDRLFACKVPEISPLGKPVITIITFADLTKKLK